MSGVAALLAVGGAGCLESSAPGNASARSGSEPGENGTPPTNRTGNGTDEDVEGSGDLVVEGVYPEEVDREYIDYEYVEFGNQGSEPLDLAGFTLHYDGDETYAFGDLALEPGASVAVLSRSGDDVTLTSDPPTYLRYAGFGESDDTSVLPDDGGRVVVRDDAGERVLEHAYGDEA